jgi:hypothetical protein
MSYFKRIASIGFVSRLQNSEFVELSSIVENLQTILYVSMSTN